MCTPCMGEAATKRFLMPSTFSTGRSGAEEFPPPRFCFYQPIRADWLLHAVLVRLDHLLDHLAANGTGLTAGQIAIVALLQVDANLPWCSFSILRAKSLCETSKTSRRILFNLHRFIRV